MLKNGFLIAVFLLWLPNIVMGADSLTITNDYIIDIKDGGDKTYNDTYIRLDYKQLYAVGFLGEWQHGFEIGGFIKDERMSAYSAMLRSRGNDQTYQVGTDQVLGMGFVGKVDLRYIHIEELEKTGDKHDLFVYGLGFDKYYGDYNYVTAVIYNDPRKSDRFSVVISNTLANQNSYLRLGVVPRSDGTLGYFGTIKYHWIVAGYAYTREFDFTTLDRKVFTLALQIPFDLKWDREEQ